jgi:hypothetical protein
MTGCPKEGAMFVMKFLAEDKPKTVEKAIEYWRNSLKEQMDLQRFISLCRWKKDRIKFIIIYRGPGPKNECCERPNK